MPANLELDCNQEGTYHQDLPECAVGQTGNRGPTPMPWYLPKDGVLASAHSASAVWGAAHSAMAQGAGRRWATRPASRHLVPSGKGPCAHPGSQVHQAGCLLPRTHWGQCLERVTAPAPMGAHPAWAGGRGLAHCLCASLPYPQSSTHSRHQEQLREYQEQRPIPELYCRELPQAFLTKLLLMEVLGN